MNNPNARTARLGLARRGSPALRQGFTLIELLTVISIIALMLSVMMSAVFQIMSWAKSVPNRVFISRLQIAIKSYQKDYDGQAPTVADDLNNTGFSPGRISGTQSLRLALVGYSIDNNALTPQAQGACDVTTVPTYVAGSALPPMTQVNYFAGIHKTYELRVGAAEMVPPSQLTWIAGGAEPTIDVFVDKNFSPVRPILYYRKHNNGNFYFADNQDYCTQTGETAAAWAYYQGLATAAKESFFLVWCGPGRKFFVVGDSFASVGN